MKALNIYIVTVLSSLSLASCEREDELRNAGLNLDLVTELAASKSTINAANGESMTLTAELSAVTNWEIHLVGQATGLTRTLSGNSDVIEQEWDGASDVPGMNNEAVKAYLILPSESDTLSSTDVNITDGKDYSSTGVLVADFASGDAVVVPGYVEPGEGVTDAQFGYYYEFSGIDNGANWFIGTVKFSPPSGDAHFPISTEDPEEVYLNMFVHGTGSSTTNINIDLQEDDNGDGGNYQDAADDTWGYGSIVPDWTGWKLVSVKLSEFNRSTQAAFGGSGNAVQEVNYIKHMQIVLGTNDPTETATARFAYPIFTIGSPFSL